MKRTFCLLTVLLLASAKLQAQADLIARIHFLGGDAISSDANSTAFTNEFCSAEARALENQTLNKMAGLPSKWFKSKIPAGAGDGTAQLRPLLDDLLKSEWIFEMRDAPGAPEYALAIHLSGDRAQVWDKNLQTVLESWMKISTQKIPNGWELKKHETPDLIRFSRFGDWVIVDCGQDKLSLTEEILPVLLKPLNKDGWLSADLNWPRLAQLFPAFARFDFPKIQMQVAGRGGELDFDGKLKLSQPLPALAQWQLPVNTIHQPFVDFTAARGITPWLQKQSWAQPYLVSPMPDQFFIWALPAVPFQTFAAAPVPNANAALAQLGPKICTAPGPNPSANSPMNMMMQATPEFTNNQISWRGIPFAAPFIRADHEKSGDYLFGGYFPNVARPTPLPQQLFAALNEPNLVFYHWEVTSNRAPQVLQISQLGLLLTHRRQLDGNSPAGKWVAHITPKFGPTLTTAVQSAPDEVTFTRRAPGGLTAAEFYALANWLEAPDFPGGDLKLPARPNLRRKPPLIHGQVPAPLTAPVVPKK